MRTKFLLVSTCLVLGFLVTAPVSIARDPWALSGDQKRGRCQFNEGQDECGFGQYPVRDRGNARQIGGFYIDPLSPFQAGDSIAFFYDVQYCGSNNWSGVDFHILSNPGKNWIKFQGNVCQFRYGIGKRQGGASTLEFEMNYYLDY
ncbi:hypothetical protein [Microcoleus sp. OTE_8_concoct_300]|uniref:hypothetical protein n=1 Tax=Microcoleus sp. OTE_8_concoct_300 TaxID=2964710 RepID=UPI00403F625B